MYSPKISEDLIPVLYYTAKAMRLPMTQLVDNLLRSGLHSKPCQIAVYVQEAMNKVEQRKMA